MPRRKRCQDRSRALPIIPRVPDPVDVARVARLARLDLAPGEAERLAADFRRVVAMADEIRAVDTSSLEPLVHAMEFMAPLRDDAGVNGLSQGQAMAGAPARSGPFFAVPKIKD